MRKDVVLRSRPRYLRGRHPAELRVVGAPLLTIVSSSCLLRRDGGRTARRTIVAVMGVLGCAARRRSVGALSEGRWRFHLLLYQIGGYVPICFRFNLPENMLREAIAETKLKTTRRIAISRAAKNRPKLINFLKLNSRILARAAEVFDS